MRAFSISRKRALHHSLQRKATACIYVCICVNVFLSVHVSVHASDREQNSLNNEYKRQDYGQL